MTGTHGTPATDKELAALHKRVAQVMINSLSQQSSAHALFMRMASIDTTEMDDESIEIIGDVKDFLLEASHTNPALLQAITKFLRDNNITAEIEQSEELSSLQQKLSGKRKRTVDNVVLFEDT